MGGAERAFRDELPVVGRGTTRTVYLEDGVVYKVETEQGRDRHSNSHEHANTDRFAEHVGVPPTTLYSVRLRPPPTKPDIEAVVLAMPYYPIAVEDGLGNAAERAVLDLIFHDASSGNLRRDRDGGIWLIDLVHAK
jgi:hypothetical protein